MVTARADAYAIALGTDVVAGDAMGAPPAPPPAPPPPPPPAPSITLSSTGAATAGSAYAVTVTAANLTGPLTVTPERVSGPSVTFDPTTVLPAPGELVRLFNLTAAAAGTLALRATAAGGIVSNELSITVNAAPAPGPTPPPPSPPPPAPAPAPEGQATGTSMVDVVSVVPVPTAVGASLWSGSKPWTCGLLFRRGAAPAGRVVGAHDGAVQVDWLTTWDDGSLRFARASGVTTAAEVPILTRGVAATGSNVAEPSVAATVSFTSVVDHLGASVAGGSFTADIATARAAGAGAWSRTQARLVRSLAGPVCSEFHYYVPTDDVHLAVWFYVRAYSSGDTEVETVVENGWLLEASPGVRTYSVNVSVGGSTRHTGAGIVHYHHTRWSRTDWVGADPVSMMTQAVASLRGNGIFPHYGVEALTADAYTAWPESGTKHAAWTRDLADRPAPFAIGNHDPAMGSGGHTDSYGVVPEWEATRQIEGHHGAYWSIIGNARATGRYHLHYRDESDGRVVRPTNRSGIGLSPISTGISDVGNSGTLTPDPAGGIGPSWTFTHSPAAAFCGAMLTARWSLIEEVQFQSALGVMVNTFNIRAGKRTIGWWDQNRSIGWRMRDMAQAEIVTPSILNGAALTTGPEFNQRQDVVGRIEGLMDLLQDQYVAGSGVGIQYSARGSALGAPWQNSDFDYIGGSVNDGTHGYGGLQSGFYITGFAYLFNCRPGIGATAKAQADAVMSHLAKYTIGLLGAAPGATRDWRVFPYVTIPLGTPGFNGSDLLATTYYGSWDIQYTTQQSILTWAAGTWPLTAGSDTLLRKIEFNGVSALRLRSLSAYTADTDLLALTWAMMQTHEATSQISIPGADLAVQRLLTSGTWSASVAGIFTSRPAFSAKTSRDLPSWVPSTVGAAALVPMTNTLDSIWVGNPAYAGTQNANELMDYSGGRFNTYAGRWGVHFVHGGGHSATHDNGVYVADFNDLSFKRVFAPTLLSTTPASSGPNLYDDYIRLGAPPDSFADSAASNPREVAPGVPGSAHTYDSMVILPPGMGGGARGSLVRVVSSSVGANASREGGWSHRFDLSSQQWSRWSNNSMGANFSAGAGAAFDPTRGRMWPIISGNSDNAVLNAITRTWTREGSALSLSAYPDLVHATHVDQRDLVVTAAQGSGSDITGPIRLVYQQAGATVPTRSTATLSAALATDGSYASGSLVYVPELQRLIWYSYDGAPDQYQEIEIPATLTDTWTVTTRAITGTVPSGFAGDPPSGWLYKRFDYAPQLRSLVWVVGKAQSEFSFGGRVLCIRVAH
jgi:hypothetical protein